MKRYLEVKTNLFGSPRHYDLDDENIIILDLNLNRSLDYCDSPIGKALIKIKNTGELFLGNVYEWMGFYGG